MSYAAPTSYAAPQMSYVPQATYGGYPGAATHSPYLDEKTIKQQETDATAALDGQAGMQQKMLDHQYAAVLAYAMMGLRNLIASGMQSCMRYASLLYQIIKIAQASHLNGDL